MTCRRKESGNVVESALVALPLIMLLIVAISISQFFGALGMVTLDVVAANMEAITRVNALGENNANPAALNASNGWHLLFHGHQTTQQKNQAILAASTEQLSNKVRLSIANAASGAASYHGNAFGIPSDQSINYDAQGLRFVQIITSSTSTSYDGNGIVVLDYQPSILRLIGSKAKVSAALLNPLMDYTAQIVTAFAMASPHSTGHFVSEGDANSGGHFLHGNFGDGTGENQIVATP